MVGGARGPFRSVRDDSERAGSGVAADSETGSPNVARAPGKSPRKRTKNYRRRAIDHPPLTLERMSQLIGRFGAEIEANAGEAKRLVRLGLPAPELIAEIEQFWSSGPDRTASLRALNRHIGRIMLQLLPEVATLAGRRKIAHYGSHLESLSTAVSNLGPDTQIGRSQTGDSSRGTSSEQVVVPPLMPEDCPSDCILGVEGLEVLSSESTRQRDNMSGSIIAQPIDVDFIYTIAENIKAMYPTSRHRLKARVNALTARIGIDRSHFYKKLRDMGIKWKETLLPSLCADDDPMVGVKDRWPEVF